MNARTKGYEEGFTESLSRIQPNKEQFEKIAWWIATHTYTHKEKQNEYFQGFMENWHEPHPQNCDCKECQNAPEVLTY